MTFFNRGSKESGVNVFGTFDQSFHITEQGKRWHPYQVSNSQGCEITLRQHSIIISEVFESRTLTSHLVVWMSEEA